MKEFRQEIRFRKLKKRLVGCGLPYCKNISRILKSSRNLLSSGGPEQKQSCLWYLQSKEKAELSVNDKTNKYPSTNQKRTGQDRPHASSGDLDVFLDCRSLGSQLNLPAMSSVTHEDATSVPRWVPDDEATRLHSEGQSFKRSLLGGNFYLLN